jgi:hypothetical protein
LKGILLPILKWVLFALGFVLLLLLVTIAYWYLRPNRSFIHPDLTLESWAAVADGNHNSNTDLIYWQDAFYLVHASSPWHFASEDCRLLVWRSPDAQDWELMAELGVEGEDIRDPKFAAVGDRLIMYALKNAIFTAEPYSTVMSVSEDGQTWSDFRDIEPQGWLFWRPKSPDGETWYMPAYWHEHGRAMLLESTDGENWSEVSRIYEGERIDETAIEFLPDGRMIATGRLEVSDSILGHDDAATLIGVSAPPYESWSYTHSHVTRLDGPYLFSYNDRVYGVGRYQPGRRGPLTRLGSIFSRKHTSLFLIQEDGLVYLSDLPSAGDTSYTGVVLREGDLYVSYYTSDVRRDYSWILGMVMPSEIRVARIDLDSLEALAETLSGE